MPSVLFVCTANQCRSPIASALFRSLLQRAGMDRGWRVESAGTWARENLPPAPKVEFVMSQQGLDIRGHRSRCINRQLLAAFNLVLTMEAGHKEALRIEFPEFSDRIYMLSEMSGRSIEIRDPIDGSLEGFHQLINELRLLISNGFEKIIQLADLPAPMSQPPGVPKAP